MKLKYKFPTYTHPRMIWPYPTKIITTLALRNSEKERKKEKRKEKP